jgi:ABC-2 type transport system ATP-binding protein
VIAAGQVVAQGTPETLRAGTDQVTHIRFELRDGVAVATLPLKARIDGGVAIIETATPTRTLNELTTWALAQGLELPNLEVARPSLEDVYLELTKNE